MTYHVGNIIVASDYNSFRGSNAANVAYANSTVATNQVAALIGVGYGNRGYGQTATVFNAVTVGTTVKASDWNTLQSIMNTMNIHQGNSTTVQNVVTVGGTVQATDGTLSRPNISVIISTLDTNRLSIGVSQTALTSELSSNTVSNWTVSVFHEFTVTFGSEDQARYYFNTGGQVYLTGNTTGGNGTIIDNTISTMLSNMGTIKFSSNATTYTGSGGTGSGIGYYNLTGTYQNLFTANNSTASYIVTARAENIVGTNGGNGSLLRFRANVNTGGSSYYVYVNATIYSNISQLASSGALSVTAPSWTTTHAIS